MKGVSASGFDTTIGLLTVLAVGLFAVRGSGIVRRLPVLLGGLAGYILYYICANHLGFGKPIDFSSVVAAPWFGLPKFVAPVSPGARRPLIALAAIVLVAENLGHVKAISAMSGRNLDPLLGRAFLGDGVATIIAGLAAARA